MKIHLCFAVMFFQLAASLRHDTKLLRSRATVLDTPAGGVKPKAGHDERGLGKTKVVTTTVLVKEVQPQQIVCPAGFTMDTLGKCCNTGAGETILSGVCCPAGVTAVASPNGKQWNCCAPGQIAAPTWMDYGVRVEGASLCCPPDTVVSYAGKCCNVAQYCKGECDPKWK
jgi:hypothetical protein